MPGKPGVLKVAIAHKRRTALISLDVKIMPNQWDKKKLRVYNHPDRLQMNVYITTVKQQIDSSLLSLANEGNLDSMSVSEIKTFIEDRLHPERLESKRIAERKANSFVTRFLKFAESKKSSTRGVYMQTYRRLVTDFEREYDEIDCWYRQTRDGKYPVREQALKIAIKCYMEQIYFILF